MLWRADLYILVSNSRVQLDEVTSENSALKDRLAVLQQDVKSLEEELNTNR